MYSPAGQRRLACRATGGDAGSNDATDWRQGRAADSKAAISEEGERTMKENKLTPDQTKAVKSWLKTYGKGYISGRYDQDQIDMDCAHDLDLQDYSKQVAALTDKYINECE
jgi:hypothetical protein